MKPHDCLSKYTSTIPYDQQENNIPSPFYFGVNTMYDPSRYDWKYAYRGHGIMSYGAQSDYIRAKGMV